MLQAFRMESFAVGWREALAADGVDVSHKRPVSTGRVGERTSLYVTIALKASPVFILLQVRVLAPAEKKVSRKTSLFCFCFHEKLEPT